MKIKESLKIFLLTWLINLIENTILLFFFGVQISLRAIVGAGVFALVLTLLIDKFILKGR